MHTRLTYFKDFECTLTVRVSGGDLCAAEAPIEPAGETKDASKFGAQFEGRDLISGSLIFIIQIISYFVERYNYFFPFVMRLL